MGKPVYHRRDNRDAVPWRMAVPARDEQRRGDECTSGHYVQRKSTIPRVRVDVDTRDAAARAYRSANDSLLEILRADFVCEYDRNRGVGSYLARRQRGDGVYYVCGRTRTGRGVYAARYILSPAFTDGSILQSDYIEAIDERGFGIR